MEMSRITTKYQATVPADVRAALGVTAGDRLGWEVRDGIATVQKVDEAPVIAGMAVIDSNVFADWLCDEDIEDWG